MLEMESALDMIACNVFFKKCYTQLTTYTSGPSKAQIDYIMVRNKDKKRVINVNIITRRSLSNTSS